MKLYLTQRHALIPCFLSAVFKLFPLDYCPVASHVQRWTLHMCSQKFSFSTISFLVKISTNILFSFIHSFIKQALTEWQLQANCCGYWDKRHSPCPHAAVSWRWLPTSSHLPATASWVIFLPPLILHNTARLFSGIHAILLDKDLSNQNSSALKI